MPALSVPLSGPQLPEAPPGLRPESGSRATPSIFVGSRQPPVTRGTRHGRCVPRLQGAAALRGRVSGGWRLGRASARARFSLGGLPLLSVASRLWGVPGFATLRSGHPIGLLPCGRPPRARRGRRTPLSSRRRPKRFCPLEPLSPHAACARTRPRFARPLPRFRGLAPRCPSLDVLGLPKKPFEHYGIPAPDPRGTRFFWEPSTATSIDGTAAETTAEKDYLKGRDSPLPPMRLRRKKSIGGRGWCPLPLLRHHFCAAHKFPYGASPLYPIKKGHHPGAPLY